MIPKILHQVWIGPNPQPEEHIRWREGWRRLHPDWEYKLWNNDNIRELELPTPLHVWDTWASKANMIRIAAVLEFGGVYADTDTEFVRNFDPLLDQRSWVVNQQPGVICNGIFASLRREPFLLWQWQEAKRQVGAQSLWGVYMMTDAVAKYQQTITIYPSALFLPYLYGYGRRPAENFPDAYSVHHWDNSWQHKPVAERVKDGEHLRISTDHLDRQVETDKPVPVVDVAPDSTGVREATPEERKASEEYVDRVLRH
jgi:mannosyltransferase OCH1-like enzyme